MGMMAKVDAFLAQLNDYRGEDIPPEIVKRVQPILNDPNFTYDAMVKKSFAAANLANWVINIVTYNQIYLKVAPLMERLRAAQEEKQNAEDSLRVVEEEVAAIESKLKELQDSFLEATAAKAKVEAEAEACQSRLSLAERLVGGLASENARWSKDIDSFQEQGTTLVGDCMLASAFVSYIGAFDAPNRFDLWRDIWLPDLSSRDIPVSDGIDPLGVLATDSAVAGWNNEGLPADRVSIENGAIITSCARWPLIIDPQLQGIKWLRNPEEARMERINAAPEKSSEEEDIIDFGAPVEEEQVAVRKSLIVTQFNFKGWLTRVIDAVQNGDTVIIENCPEEIDTVLDPVLGRMVYKKGRSSFIRLGGEEVPYDPQFKLYLQTKLANPHYKPEVAAQCTLVNFIVTEKGLEDQLLAKVVGTEQPDLQQQSADLLASFNRYKIQLLELEDNLLEALANAPDDILSDVPLIEGLEKTKKTALEINEAVEKGKETEIVIAEARDQYRPIAAEASMLYFILITLNKMDHMYQYSLDSFVVFFFKSIERAEPNEDVAKRVDILRESLRFTIYTWVSRGLFEKHILIFLTQLTLSLIRKGIIGEGCGYSPQSLRWLLRGGKGHIADEDNSTEWLPDANWNSCNSLTEVEGFEKFADGITESGPR